MTMVPIDIEGQRRAQLRVDVLEAHAQELESAAAVHRARAASIRNSWNLPAGTSHEKHLTSTHDGV